MPSLAGRVSRDVVARTGARVAASAMQAAALILTARALGVEEFGILAVFTAIGAVLNTVTSGGATTRLLRLGAEEDGRALASSLFWVQAIGSVVVLAGLLVAAQLTGHPGAASAGALLAFGDQQAEFAVSYFSGLAKQLTASSLILAQRAVGLLAAGSATVSGASMVLTVCLGGIAVGVLATAATPTWRGPPSGLLRVVTQSVGYWWSGLVGNVGQLEPIVVGAFGGAAVAGRYAIASRLVNPLTIVVASLRAVAVPELARTRDPAEFRRVFRLLLGLVVGYAVLLAIASPLIAGAFVFLAGPDYESARPLATVMVIATGLSAVSQGLQARFIAAGEPAKPAWAIAGGGSIGLVLLAVLAGTRGGELIWMAPLTTQALILLAMVCMPVRVRPVLSEPL